MVLVVASSFASQSHPVPVQTDIDRDEKLEVVDHPGILVVAPSARTLYLVHPLHPHSLFEAGNVNSLMRKTRWACFVVSRRAPKTAPDLVRMSLGGFAS